MLKSGWHWKVKFIITKKPKQALHLMSAWVLQEGHIFRSVFLHVSVMSLSKEGLGFHLPGFYLFGACVTAVVPEQSGLQAGGNFGQCWQVKQCQVVFSMPCI